MCGVTFLVVVANVYVLVTLIGAYIQNHDFCFPLTCINVNNYYVVDIDECLSSPCENGGTCSTPQLNMFSCKCAAGYTGTNCESGK